MPKPTDIRCVAAKLYFLPVHTRVPLKFGAETVTYVTCARACITVVDRNGRKTEGWGETPLSVQWVWPSLIPYEKRHEKIKQFCVSIAESLVNEGNFGHPIEIGADFQEHILPQLQRKANAGCDESESMPWLASLLCCSLFDIAIHDAYGKLHERSTYATYNSQFMSRTLDQFLTPAADAKVSFCAKFPSEFLVQNPPTQLPAWHLVGGLDPLDASELIGNEPKDGYPITLTEWIQRDGLNCLKIKLRGNDTDWDYRRLVKVGEIAQTNSVEHLSADFNCTVRDPMYVNEILDRLKKDHPAIFESILYVEQPFPYELEHHRIDVHSVSQRRALFLDESAHDWRLVKLGRELGWTGVALKTCKTQTGALLSCCWAKAHGMQLMVQDLTNPMLAQIPHVLLAANVGTIMGVETNAMQFYPDASLAESKIHPGLYRRRNGKIDLSTIRGNGFGYRLDEIQRDLPTPAVTFA